MAVVFDSQLFEGLPTEFSAAQRALFYGDALFETMRVFDGRIPFLGQHWLRLSAGMRQMGYDLPAQWSASFFEEQIQSVAEKNNRVRLTVWRAPGGLYAPETNMPHYLITTQLMPANRFEWLTGGIALDVCDTVRLPIDQFSNLKSLNTPRYVAAAQWARSAGLDDALVLNAHDRICEATSSNVFWWENGNLCTIPLTEGCVAGVLRAFLLEIAAASGLAVREKPATFAALLDSDEIFLTNAVRGIVPVHAIAGHPRADLKTKELFATLTTQIFGGL